jgi:hypothetical protein
MAAPRGGGLSGWLSLVCADPAAHHAAARYLDYLAPGLAHLGPEPLRIEVQVVASESVPGVGPGAMARDRYQVARLGSDLAYALAGQGTVRIDAAAGRVSIRATTDPGRDSDLISGLLSIALQEIAAHRGFFGLHAGAVTRDGASYLLPGASGSGKSSLCATLVRGGFRYLTDDFVLLTLIAGRVHCVPFFRSMTLDAAWGERFPELSFVRGLPAQPGGKRTFDPDRGFPGSQAARMSPTALVFPSIVTRADSVLRPISRRDAFCRLLPQSRMSAATRIAEAHVRMLEALVGAAAAFELEHGADFLRAPDTTLRRLLETLGPAPVAAKAR